MQNQPPSSVAGTLLQNDVTALEQRKPPIFPILIGITAIGCLLLTWLGYGQAVLMGIVQGLGEFLPISSSAHLILVPWLFGWEGDVIGTVTFDVALHVGTLCAIVGFFWRDWLNLTLSAFRPHTEHGRLFWLMVLGTLPAVLVGLLVDQLTDGNGLRLPALIAVTMAVMGVVLYAADRWGPQNRRIADLGVRDAVLIGIAQAAALIPGVSRSGATMSMGRASGLDREAAARFSFLLSTPITVVVGLGKLVTELDTIIAADWSTFLVGVVVSGIVGALSIGFLLRYIRQVGFGIFALYRVLLAVLIVAVLLIRGY